MPAAGASLPAELAAALTAMTGIVVRQADFDLEKVPDHLRMTFTVVDDQGRPVAGGKDLPRCRTAAVRHPAGGGQGVAAPSSDTGLTAFPAGRRRAQP